ncbi:MAG: AI-2E family transporter [Spirochaetales bacterium]|uniref:AI-2E family transporter n=1 Tax=Candidatus Thalassospirochaeta sargassi TaxID=3119039 RepID=A0AAJ1IHU8_9SPIO|nr:AI-2E family transporter [Spirochaetales bacterium]
MNNQRANTIFIGVIAIVATVAALKIASSVMLPIFFAILLSFTLSPVVDGLTRIKVPRGISITLAILIIAGIGYLVGLFLFSSLNSFIDEAPKYYHRFEDITSQISGALNTNFAMELPENPMAEIDFTATFINSINSLSQNVVSFASAMVIVILSTIFLLLESPYIQVTIAKAFPRKAGKRIIIIMRHTIRQIGRYLSVKFLVSAMTGVFVWLFLEIIGMDFSLIWGVLAFILNFIPNIGSVILMAVTIIMGFIQFFPQPGPIVAVVVSMISVQIVVGNFLDPRMQGRRLNLSPIIIIFSLFLWGWIWGPVGMFIAVPITAVIKIICENVPPLKPIAMLMENGRKVSKNRRFI